MDVEEAGGNDGDGDEEDNSDDKGSDVEKDEKEAKKEEEEEEQEQDGTPVDSTGTDRKTSNAATCAITSLHIPPSINHMYDTLLDQVEFHSCDSRDSDSMASGDESDDKEKVVLLYHSRRHDTHPHIIFYHH